MTSHIALRLCPNCALLHPARVEMDGRIFMLCPLLPAGHGLQLNGLTVKENIQRLILEARGN